MTRANERWQRREAAHDKGTAQAPKRAEEIAERQRPSFWYLPCAALHVSKQWCYRFLRRLEQGLRDCQLLEQIYACLREDEENGETYRVRWIIA